MYQQEGSCSVLEQLARMSGTRVRANEFEPVLVVEARPAFAPLGHATNRDTSSKAGLFDIHGRHPRWLNWF